MASDPRVNVTFRLGPKARDWLDEVADELRVDRSVVLRAALTVAAAHKSALVAKIAETKAAG